MKSVSENKSRRSILINGISYVNQKTAYETLKPNMSYQQFCKRVKRGFEDDELLDVNGKIPLHAQPHFWYKVVLDDVKFPIQVLTQIDTLLANCQKELTGSVLSIFANQRELAKIKPYLTTHKIAIERA